MMSRALNAASTVANGYLYSADAIDKLPALDVVISSLVPGFYLRQAGTDMIHVRLLADAAWSTSLPPILVQKNGLRIIDGMHRIEAAKLRSETHISARVLDCTDEEAFILAVQSNTLHGLPLSKADRIAGAKRILVSHPDWSDRAVASVTGLSAKTVSVLRNRSTSEIPALTKRLGRDGKKHPLSGAEGRLRAAEYIKEHPDAPLRQVARAADVSLGTVHDVRERLRRGVDPMLGRREAMRQKESGHQEPSRPQARTSWDATSQAKDCPTVVTRPEAVSAIGSGRGMRAGNGVRNGARPLLWPAISAKLGSDPTLRYTEGGRAFLRWMSLHAAHTEDWREFVDVIPEHWLREVDLLASSVSEEWRMFAEWLRGKQESAS